MKKHKVRDVVRVCEPTYKVEELKTEGINVTDLAYDDGTSPPSEVSPTIGCGLVISHIRVLANDHETQTVQPGNTELLDYNIK